MTCQERDRLLTAFAVAVHAQNTASSRLEKATDETERTKARTSVENSRNYCYQLRDLIQVHCVRHGC